MISLLPKNIPENKNKGKKDECIAAPYIFLQEYGTITKAHPSCGKAGDNHYAGDIGNSEGQKIKSRARQSDPSHHG
jgi:hypothetical protein